ncbi:uncharacterized protein RCC_09290 [Ramularia collo-cygni]|uniref:Uncharacterized protein n=1 Tax=Ramularia collo-cygni TaxID=112498 RepID=A0A2D3V2I3_9PEZI|nr:uncharacterized protein RCC_09290 [Ramularia collo-cygni]CZT23576.1 uncharacterized protein RCC_09290 [Ramularia collo-cygni]
MDLPQHPEKRRSSRAGNRGSKRSRTPSEPHAISSHDRDRTEHTRKETPTNTTKSPQQLEEPVRPQPRQYLRKYEEEYLPFNKEERAFPSGVAYAHGSLIIGSALPDHGLMTAKTKLLHRGENLNTGEKTLVTLTTPDTREVDFEELVAVHQAGLAVDEEGRARTGLVVPPKFFSRSRHEGRRRSFSEGDRAPRVEGSIRAKKSKGKRAQSSGPEA